jgi:hypothetical protein
MKCSCEGYEIRLKEVPKIEFMDTSKCKNFIHRPFIVHLELNW